MGHRPSGSGNRPIVRSSAPPFIGHRPCSHLVNALRRQPPPAINIPPTPPPPAPPLPPPPSPAGVQPACHERAGAPATPICAPPPAPGGADPPASTAAADAQHLLDDGPGHRRPPGSWPAARRLSIPGHQTARSAQGYSGLYFSRLDCPNLWVHYILSGVDFSCLCLRQE